MDGADLYQKCAIQKDNAALPPKKMEMLLAHHTVSM
jgi:hypothetical protein